MRRAFSIAFLVVLLVVLPAHAAITLVSHVSGNSSSGIPTTGIDTTGATVLVANIDCYGAGSAPVLSDSKSNIWSPTSAVNLNPVWHILFYSANPTVGTGHTFTIATAIDCSIEVAAFSGVTGVLPLDSYLTSSGTASTAQAGSITPANANSVVISGIGFAATQTLSSIDSGFTITDNVAAVGGCCEGGALAYLVQTTVTIVNPQWTMAGSSAYHVTNLVLIAGSATPPLSPALVSHVSLQFITTATSSAIDTTGASLIVINQSGFAALGTVSDSKSNTWTALTQQGVTNLLETLYYCTSCIVGTGHTFTVTSGSSGSIQVVAFSGTKTTSTLDTSAGSDNLTQGTSFQLGSVTPANAKAVVVMGIAIQNSTPSTVPFGVDQPFNVVESSPNDGSHIGGSIAFYIQSTPVTMNPFWYLNAANRVAGENAVFIAAPAATVGVPRHHGGIFQ